MAAVITILTIHCAVYRLYCGPYCECNRDRGTADRLLGTIAIAAIDIQHYTLTGVPTVLWGLLSVQQGQRYGRQTIGHYSNSSNRHAALYINRCTVCTVGLTVSATGTEVRQTDYWSL